MCAAVRENACMGEVRAKNLMSPDATLEFDGITVQQVDVGDLTVGRIVTQPGWRWSTHVRPHVGGDWCEARHVGIVLSGRFEIVMRDGTTLQFGPEDVFEIPPGHDGYTLGDEPCVQIEWSGLRAFAGFRLVGAQHRALVTLLFTDLVDSTATAGRLGDVAWRDALSAHYEATRVALERHHGHEVNTTGDGLLATFDGPAAALRCAAAVGRAAVGKACGSVRACMSEKWISLGQTCAASRCMKRHGSSVPRPPTRSWCRLRLARWRATRASCSSPAARTFLRACQANGSSLHTSRKRTSALKFNRNTNSSSGFRKRQHHNPTWSGTGALVTGCATRQDDLAAAILVHGRALGALEVRTGPAGPFAPVVPDIGSDSGALVV